MEDNVTLNDNYEYNDDQNQHEEEKIKKEFVAFIIIASIFHNFSSWWNRTLY